MIRILIAASFAFTRGSASCSAPCVPSAKRFRSISLESAARLGALVLVFSFLQSSVLLAQMIVDQSNETADNLRSIEFFSPVGQSFTPSLSAIDFVDLKLNDVSSAAVDHTVFVRVRDGDIDGPVLGSSETLHLPDCFHVPGPPGCGIAGGFEQEVQLDFGVPVPLVPGDLYVLELVTTGDLGVFDARMGDPYSGGTAYFDGMVDLDRDLWFREGITIPEPSVVTLMAGGLLLCSGMRSLRSVKRT